MFSLILTPRTLMNALIFWTLFLIFFGLAYRSFKKGSPLSFFLPILLQAVVFIIYLGIVSINHDESEHLHCAWLVGQGLVPFRDFWQHHSPLLWVVAAPFVRVFKPSAAIFEVSRLFSLGVFLCILLLGWRLAKKAWGKKAQVRPYLLMAASITIYGEYFRIRPDLCMTLFLLAGVYATLAIPQGRLFGVFAAGVAMGLAESFIFKQYLIVLLPVITLVIFRKKISLVRGICVYALGIALGVAPLFLYLAKNKILDDFIQWVFLLNRGRLNVGMMVPLAAGALGVLGAARLSAVYRQEKNPSALIVAIAFWLSTASSFTGMISGGSGISPREGYYQQFWLILCGVAVSGGVISELVYRQANIYKKAAVAGAIFTLLAASNFFYSIPEQKAFSRDKKTLNRLIAYSRGDSCVMLLPMHPIFCSDATRIYSYWQYVFCGAYEVVRNDAKSMNIARALLDKPPAVILSELDKRDFMLDLFLRGLISKDDYRPIQTLFENEYTEKTIGITKCYIRNDRL